MGFILILLGIIIVVAVAVVTIKAANSTYNLDQYGHKKGPLGRK